MTVWNLFRRDTSKPIGTAVGSNKRDIERVAAVELGKVVDADLCRKPCKANTEKPKNKK